MDDLPSFALPGIQDVVSLISLERDEELVCADFAFYYYQLEAPSQLKKYLRVKKGVMFAHLPMGWRLSCFIAQRATGNIVSKFLSSTGYRAFILPYIANIYFKQSFCKVSSNM